MPIFAGFLSDRIGRRPVILLGLFGFSFFTLLSGFTTSHYQMYVTRFLTGVTEPFFSVAMMAYFMELFPQSPAFFVSLMMSGTSVGWFAGPFLSGWSLQTLGSWRHPFWIMGIAGLVLFCILLFYWYDQKVPRDTVQVATPQPSRYGKATRVTVLITLSLIVFFDCVAEFGFSMWLPSFLKEERKFPIAQAGVIASMWGIGQFFGRPLLGLVSDRTGYRHIAIPAAFILGLSFYFIVTSQTYSSFIFWQLTAGFIGGALMGSLWAFTAIFYGKTKGTALGLISNLGNAGAAVAPVIGGYLADRASLEKSLLIMGVIPPIICSLLFLSSFVWVKENVRTWSKNK